MTTPIRIAIVDDQGMVRAGFRSLLADEPDLEVVGEAANGEEAVELVARLRAGRHADGHPDARARRPRRDPAARRGAASPTRVLVLTTFDLDEYVFEALRAGASGFLLKDAPPRSWPPRSASSPPGTRCSRPASPAG